MPVLIIMITVYAENYTHIPEISVWYTYIHIYIHIHILLLVLTRAYNTNVIMTADLQEIFSNILMAL